MKALAKRDQYVPLEKWLSWWYAAKAIKWLAKMVVHRWLKNQEFFIFGNYILDSLT